MSNVNTHHQSKYGFHPCSYEFYLKLKFLHRCYWQTLYDFHRWHRWWRKEPQNRVGPEPKYCDVFELNCTWYKPVHRRGVEGFKVYPKRVTDHGMVDLYQQARVPQQKPIEPFDESTSKQIDSLYAKVQQAMA